ncbi:MAG: hypothetical protein MPN21_10835 [Thermoanaerobaculia bacterium]|nr:hypothetical protein [Thermoanaerobaculia bacterium]
MRRSLSVGMGCVVLIVCTVCPSYARDVELALDLDGWHRFEGPNFELYSDAPPAVAAEVLVELERFRALFARLAPGLDLRSPAPLRMIAFNGPRSFAPYKTRRDGGGTLLLGQFHRHPDANYLLLDGRTRIGADYSVALHELTHFFVTHNVPRAPLWLNEGLAEYYGTFTVEGDQAVVGRAIERHVDLLLLKNQVQDLDVLLETDGRTAAGHDPREVGQFYALSWLLVHYLLSQPDGPDHTADYIVRLSDGEDGESAFETSFGLSLREMEQELRLYVARGEFPRAALPVVDLEPGRVTVGAARPADVLCLLGDFVLHVGAVDYAAAHYRRALELDPSHAVAHGGLATVRDLHGSWQESELLFRDAHRLGVADPLTFVRYARHSLSYPNQESDGFASGASKPWLEATSRARNVLDRAVRAEPHYAVAYQLLAASHLGPGGDPSDGLDAALVAQRIQPIALLPRLLEVRLRLELAEDVRRGGGQTDLAVSRIADLGAFGAPQETVVDLELRVDVARWLRRSVLALARGEVEEGLSALDHAVSAAADPDQRRRLEARLLRLRGSLASDSGS